MAPNTRSRARAETPASVVQGESREASAIPADSQHGTVSDSDSELDVAKPKNRKRGRKERHSPENPVEPPVKRVRGKKGKLRGLMNMPIDVFTEISKHLYPLDLILLARSNKFFRQLLMNRSAVQTWRYALGNVSGLPPCPKELCEPQYAALVFSKYCSLCGNQALRAMDPVLQVRLCPSCRDSRLSHVGYHEQYLVPNSSDIVPSKNGRRAWWCLSDESDRVIDKLNELNHVGDKAATHRWREEKIRDVAERINNARPLAEFITQMEKEQKESLVNRKGGREQEIHTRLLELGWIAGDFVMRERQDVKKWTSLVYVAKPLTERNWESILPQLTSLLEHNRELRLGAEATMRRHNRYSQLVDWIRSMLRELPPYAFLDNRPPLTSEESMNAKEIDPDFKDPQKHMEPSANGSTITSSDRTLKSPTPSSNLVLSWTPLRLLWDTDMLNEQFRTAMEESRSVFTALLIEWRAKLERALANRLEASFPLLQETSVACTSEKFASVTPGAVPELDVLVDSRPINTLPLDIQRLFRADTVFICFSSVRYYPDDLQDNYTEEATSWSYDEETSNIAKALLVSMGRPNATYLEMKAAGSTFACGICCARNRVTWRNILIHYREEKRQAKVYQAHPLVKNGSINYVSTHDIHSTQRDQPLVRMANEEDQKSTHTSHSGLSRCLICGSLGAYGYYAEAATLEHVRNVHLIQDPEKDKHYR